jgi:hypothetical protein
MNKWIIIIALSFLIYWPGISWSGELYSPDGCDFTVEFPNKYQIKTLYLPSKKTVLQASCKIKDGGRLAAECYNSSISKNEFISFISEELKNRGASVYNVQPSSHMGIDTVVASGSIVVAEKKLFIKVISYFGDNSRLDLIQIEGVISSKESLSFRNSVRIK